MCILYESSLFQPVQFHVKIWSNVKSSHVIKFTTWKIRMELINLSSSIVVDVNRCSKFPFHVDSVSLKFLVDPEDACHLELIN